MTPLCDIVLALPLRQRRGRERIRARELGKKPLLVIIDEQVIEDAKIAAIRDKTKVSQVVEDLLRGWLVARKSRQ